MHPVWELVLTLQPQRLFSKYMLLAAAIATSLMHNSSELSAPRASAPMLTALAERLGAAADAPTRCRSGDSLLRMPVRSDAPARALPIDVSVL
jgi:hypothetical protein